MPGVCSPRFAGSIKGELARKSDGETNVYGDPFLEAREHFLSAVVQLPPEYLGTNAAPLQNVITELQRSYVLEMAIIMRIKRLDVTDPAMVQDYAQRFDDYRLTRAYNNERSNCGVIREMARTIIATLKSGNAVDRDRIAERARRRKARSPTTAPR